MLTKSPKDSQLDTHVDICGHYFKSSVWPDSTHVQADCGKHEPNKYDKRAARAYRLETDRSGIPGSCSGAMSVSRLS